MEPYELPFSKLIINIIFNFTPALQTIYYCHQFRHSFDTRCEIPTHKALESLPVCELGAICYFQQFFANLFNFSVSFTNNNSKEKEYNGIIARFKEI